MIFVFYSMKKEFNLVLLNSLNGCAKQMIISPKRIIFVIGGPYGFSGEVYDRADYKISLSKLTFPHQLVRLLFLEQLYRAFTVIKGEPYHHE